MASLLCRRLPCLSFSRLHVLRKQYSSSSGAASAALRPFYFAVHPDFLWQHPTKKWNTTSCRSQPHYPEPRTQTGKFVHPFCIDQVKISTDPKEVNEKSLKQLNQLIESLQNDSVPEGPTSLQFYLRKSETDSDHSLVDIPLDRSSLKATIFSILSSCNLPVLDEESEQQLAFNIDDDQESHRNKCLFYRKLYAYRKTTMAGRIAKADRTDLLNFLSDQTPKAQAVFQGTGYMRKIKDHHTQLVKKQLKLKDIIWDNKWTCQQHRNCIEDFARLSKQYQNHMHHLTNRTLVFGNDTGCHLSGDLIFGCGDSRRLWVELLQKVPECNELLKRIRKAEAKLMEQLPGTRIAYRNCSPSLDLRKYLHWLQRLSYVLEPYLVDNKLPELPSRDPLRLVINCNATNMEVLKSGEIDVCPHLSAAEVVNFLTTNCTVAAENLKSFTKETYEEHVIQEKCAKALAVGFLFKDENVSPENMTRCCERLLQNHISLKKIFQNLHICVSEYYILVDDGTLCIPWNWKSYKIKN